MRVKKLGSPTAKNEEQVFFPVSPCSSHSAIQYTISPAESSLIESCPTDNQTSHTIHEADL